MTHAHNDPACFADELIEGLVAANRSRIVQVDGGVIRRHRAAPNSVVMVIGGGSGHYPAFGGLVGQGLAHGAAMGNVFASPSAEQICAVAQAVHAGGGILFCYNNYAGDVLNFDEAQRRLRALGIDVRTVVVTDDIASAPPTEQHRRRGIAGSLAVFKAAGWACDSGASLDEVVRIASMANERVRTLGVAFSGCTLPGASAPLFSVEKGRMEVGMGIHGEPGLRSIAAPSAHGLAQQFVTELLADVPSVVRTIKGARVAVILNGLGAVKYEELFVIYRSVDRLLAERGLTIVEPEVGEMVTSFDMAGVSLSLVWLDEELERSWTAASDTPAFRKGSVAPSNGELAETALRRTTRVLKPGSDASRAAAAVALEALHDADRVIAAASDELGRLDAVAGDGDHGIGMQRGLAAAVEAAEQALAAGVGVGTLLVTAGEAWAHRAGGTSGALWGVLLHQLGDALGDVQAPDGPLVATGFAAALRGVTESGKAKVGDKTMVDALNPFARALAAATADGRPLRTAWPTAAHAASQAAHATATLTPKIGRARPHAQRSVGTPDPGAISMAMILQAVGDVLAKRTCS
jgi:dihydroxyacetone kinase